MSVELASEIVLGLNLLCELKIAFLLSQNLFDCLLQTNDLSLDISLLVIGIKGGLNFSNKELLVESVVLVVGLVNYFSFVVPHSSWNAPQL